MYVGYFFEYSMINLLFFILLLFILFFLTFLVLNKNDLFFAIYTWMFFYLIFPKKSIVVGLNSVITNMVNLSDDLLIATKFSFYDIMNSMILAIILYKILFLKEIKHNNFSKTFVTIFSLLLAVGILQNIYFNLFLTSQFGENYLNQFHYLLKIVEGLIFSVAIYYSINSKQQLNLLFNIAIFASIITVIEFFLAQYTSFLPDFIRYFVIDYRGGFRSFIHSGPLIVGMVLFYGFLGILYKRNYNFIFLIILMILPVFYTYQRSIMLLFIVSSILFFFLSIKYKNLLEKIIQGTILLLLIVPLFYASFTIFFNSFDENFNISSVDGTVIKADGWFNFTSSDPRNAVAKRGLDVFYAYPLFGSGPGNIELMMSSDQIIPKANLSNMNQETIQGYYDVITGYHPTDPHNFYVRIIGEYGIFGIMFLIILGYLFFSKIIKINIVNNEKMIAICGISSISLYALLQTFPISFPLLIFLFRIMDIDDV